MIFVSILNTKNPTSSSLSLDFEHACLGIVNGMGTKGASLAPYFVNQFVEFLLEGE
jgi:hypothetical protein